MRSVEKYGLQDPERSGVSKCNQGAEGSDPENSGQQIFTTVGEAICLDLGLGECLQATGGKGRQL